MSVHKAYVDVEPENEAGRAAVAAAVDQVLADYGVRLLVRATDEQLAALAAAGFPVELAGNLDRVTFSHATIDTSAAGAPSAAPAIAAAPSGEEPFADVAPGEPGVWIVQFVGPPLPPWVEAVRAAGGEVIGPIPESAILVRMTQAQAAEVAGQGVVQWVGPYEPRLKVHPMIAGREEPVPSADGAPAGALADTAPGEPGLLLIALFDPASVPIVVGEIEAHGGRVESVELDVIVCELPPEAVSAIAALPAVAKIEPFLPPQLELDVARRFTRVQTLLDTHGLDGEGEILGVSDTGLDRGVDNNTLHQDFWQLTGDRRGRVTGHALGRTAPPLWDDPDGHGTHVAGIAVGNGRMSRGRYRGVAYQAHLVMQSLFVSPAATIGGAPANLNLLYDPVYGQDRVRIHNSSWGNNTLLGQYLVPTYQIDQAAWRHPDLVVVRSAGNYGTDVNNVAGVAPADGIVDFSTVGRHATCRNGISVGASENQKPNIETTNSMLQGVTFATDPLQSDKVADNPEQMAAFSSRGPTNAASGSRIKPDVVAPGTSILAPLSRLVASPSEGWGPARPDSQPYFHNGGTSMAAPHVAGMCALIRQYLRRIHGISDPDNPDARRRRPSSALIKALLVHGARQIQGRYSGSAVDNCGPVPSNHQGWGRVDLRRSLFSSHAGPVAAQDNGWLPRRTIFLDSPDIRLTGVAPPGGILQHDVRVTVANNAVPLRATLVWTDFPGPAAHPGTLVNRLQLEIHRLDAAGNQVGAAIGLNAPAGLLPAGLNLADNNVQQIDVSGANLQAGDYRVRVFTAPGGIGSFPVAGEGQDFALVISGAISHSDHADPLAAPAPLPDLAFIDLGPGRDGQERHDGLAPSPEPPVGDLGSPDIWVSSQPDPQAQPVAQVTPGQRHHVFVRVRNLGFAPANGAGILLYWADPRTPMLYPDDWKADGIAVNGAPGNEVRLDVPARGEVVAGPFAWDVPRDLNYLALFARAVHADDPIVREGEVRWDNNITRRDLYLQDNATQVQGSPSGWDRFVFCLLTFGGSPRTIDAWLQISYEDARDGQMKPLPAGVEVEIWDQDITFDDKLATGHTIQYTDAEGKLASAVRLRFSTSESGERGPDLFCHVLMPSGRQYEDFIRNSYFLTGSPYWRSLLQEPAQGGFYLDDFGGDTIGITEPVRMEIRLIGKIWIRASFEFYSGVLRVIRKLPAGIAVKILDSNPSAPGPLLATATTDENGEIGAAIQQRTDYQPSIYFRIERGDGEAFQRVEYFRTNAVWESKDRQGEAVAPDGSVRAISGHFQNLSLNRLIPPPDRVRFRLDTPTILMHLRFEFFDREAATPPATGYVPLPPGVEVGVFEDNPDLHRPLVTALTGADGRAEITVPKGDRDRLTLFARVSMRRVLQPGTADTLPDTVEVRQNGDVLSFETRGATSTDGTSGLFADVQTNVATAAAPLVFRFGGPADATDRGAAPFILKALGEAHAWMRTRTGNTLFAPSVDVELVHTATGGSSCEPAAGLIRLNADVVPPLTQPDSWSRRAIVHQYGHLLLSFGGWRANPTGVANHRGFNAGGEIRTVPAAPDTDAQNRRIALAEGWAEYLADAHSRQTVQSGPIANQTRWRGADNDGTNNSGEVVPRAVANLLEQLDRDIVAAGHAAISDPVNQRRFRALLWEPLLALRDADARQVPFHFYRMVQGAALEDRDLIPPRGIAHIRQEVRRVFEANGLVFTRGRVVAANRLTAQNLAAAPPTPENWRFLVERIDPALLHIAEIGTVRAYRMQAAPVGTTNFVNLEIAEIALDHNGVPVTQQATIDVNFTAARQTRTLAAAGTYLLRVRAMDEFGAWDTFADDFTGNVDTGGTGVTNNLTWQQARLHSIHVNTIVVP